MEWPTPRPFSGHNVLSALAGAVALAAAPVNHAVGEPFVTGGGSGPIHRRGRFKPNQRKQRRGRR